MIKDLVKVEELYRLKDEKKGNNPAIKAVASS